MEKSIEPNWGMQETLSYTLIEVIIHLKSLLSFGRSSQIKSIGSHPNKFGSDLIKLNFGQI